MAKRKQTEADDIEIEQQDAESETLKGPTRKREKSRYVLEQLFDKSAINDSVDSRGIDVWWPIESAPHFDDTPSAIKWGTDFHYAGKLRVVVIKAVFELVTKEIKVTSVKAVTP